MCDSSQSVHRPGLYLVATPIGNLGDLGPRARSLLNNAQVVACEDTRTARRLFAKGDRLPRLVALTEHNTNERTPALLDAAREGVVAVISEAGMPGIADPGARVVEAAHESSIPVYVIPGPSAIVAAVAASGFDTSEFRFAGFAPRKASALAATLELGAGGGLLVLLESPRRLAATLETIAATLDDPRCCVSREISKIHEEHVRGRASALAERFRETKGECVVVVELPPRPEAPMEEVGTYMAEMQRAGARRSSAAVEAARRFGCPRDTAYRLWEGE
jgi:16S rRNA (cytidine1402-2'-O)-methyltransferase